MTQLKSIAPLKAAFARFQEALRIRVDDLDRDGAIQRFEYTFELAWKAMKATLGLCQEADQVLHGRDSCRPDC